MVIFTNHVERLHSLLVQLLDGSPETTNNSIREVLHVTPLINHAAVNDVSLSHFYFGYFSLNVTKQWFTFLIKQQQQQIFTPQREYYLHKSS